MVSFQRKATCLIWKIRYWTKLGKEIRVFHRFRQVEWFAWFHLDRTIGFSTPPPFLLSFSTLITLSPRAQLNYERTEKSESQLKRVFCIVFFSPRSFDRTLSYKRGLRLELVGAWQKSGRNEDAFVRIKSGSLIHPSPSFFCSIWIGKNSLTQFRRRTSLTARAPFQLLAQGLSAESGGSVETIKARDEALILTVIQDTERRGEFQSYQIFN